MEIVLDTSAYTLLAFNNEQAISMVAPATQIWLPSIVLGELLFGFEKGSRTEENTANLEQFLRSSRVEVANISKSTAERYGKIFNYLRTIGKPIPTNDVWIAAVAMEKGAALLTADKHFGHVQQVFVEFLGD